MSALKICREVAFKPNILSSEEWSIFGIKIRTLGSPENREGRIQGLLKGKKFAPIPVKNQNL